jgi:hypothetical protein
MYAYSGSRHIMAQLLEIYLSYFSNLLIIILIFHGIIINLLLLYRLPYFAFCLLVIFMSFCVVVLNL